MNCVGTMRVRLRDSERLSRRTKFFLLVLLIIVGVLVYQSTRNRRYPNFYSVNASITCPDKSIVSRNTRENNAAAQVIDFDQKLPADLLGNVVPFTKYNEN